MPDTHDDDNGGAEAAMLTAIRRRALTASTYAEWHQVARDVETLVEQLAAATARAEKAEARLAAIGLLLPVMTDALAAGTAQAARSAEFVAKAIAHHHRGESEHLAADAPQDELSATQTDADGSQASPEGSNSSASPERPQEPEPERDPSAWCWAPNPHTLLHCGRLRDHEPPHRRGERTWTSDDTTEGR